MICSEIVKKKIFNMLTVTVISMNCCISAWYSNNENPVILKLDYLFLSYYISEMIIKMSAISLFSGENSYFRNFWDVTDFLIILISFIFIFIPSINFKVSALRALKIINALNIKSLKATAESIIASFHLMRETFLIFLCLISFYAIIGTIFFNKLFYKKCFLSESGVYSNFNNDLENFCGRATNCPKNYVCGNLLVESPDFGATSFNDFSSSSLQIIRVVTFNNWTFLMNLTQTTLSQLTFIYFITLTIFGNFFALNLILGVLKIKYSEKKNNIEDLKIENVKNNIYDLKLFRNRKFYIKKNIKYLDEEIYILATKKKFFLFFKKLEWQFESKKIK